MAPSCNVLLIEDNPAYRAMLRRFFAEQDVAGLALQEAADLYEGLRLIAADEFDLVLLDHTLPHGSALDDLREVRAGHPDLPVVLHTGYLSPADTAEAFAQGARDVVIKGPFAHLWAAIERVCPQFGGRGPRPVSGAPGVTVLVVEDHPEVRGMMERTLREEGYGAVVAEDGRHALELLEALPDAVDVVVADIRMPHMDGTELGRILAERRPDLPVIYTSGYPDEQRRQQREDGAPISTFLSKPFSPTQLLAAVQGVLARHRRLRPPPH